MAFSQDDYQNIPSSGIIPSKLLPADQFSFAYTFIYERDVNPSQGFLTTIDAHIKLQLRDAAGNLKATFDGYESYNVTMFGAPGLAFYFWNWNINKENFIATDGAGNPLTTEGKFSLGVDPGGGEGYTDRTAIVTSTFYSYIFNVDINEGDALKIVEHNVSAQFTTDKASLQIATRKGSSGTGLFDPRCGQQFRAFVRDGKTRVVRNRRADSPLTPEQTEWTPAPGSSQGVVIGESLSGISLARGSGDMLFLLGKVSPHLKMFQSDNEGEDWEQVMAEKSEITPLASCLSADGSVYFVYGLNADRVAAYGIIKHGDQGWKISESGPCIGEGLPVAKVDRLERSYGDELRLLATGSSGEILIFSSLDGKTYAQEVTPDVH